MQLIVVARGCAFAGLIIAFAFHLQTKAARAESASDRAEKEWLSALRAPGPDHERLNGLVGRWKTTIRQWKGPDAEPIALSGTAVRSWVLGHRFIEERAENKTSKGGTVQSIGYLGYNRRTQLYEHIWMLNAATGMFIERGRYDPDTNAIRTTGAETNPATGATILTATELKIESPERHTLSAYATGTDGVRWKQLEIIYSKN